jgi:hypothetical protein
LANAMENERKHLIRTILANALAAILGIIALMLVCVVVPLGLKAWFVSSMFSPIPNSALNPPIYPGAHEIMIDDDTKYATKVIAYLTDAPTDEVLAFYRDTFDKDNWFVPISYNNSTLDYVYEWHQSGPDGPTDTAFRSILTVESLESNGTKVRLSVRRFDPR